MLPTVDLEDINYREALYLTVWDNVSNENVRAYGPFDDLDSALAQVGPVEDTFDGLDATVLLTGVDETGESFDAYEPMPGETAAGIRRGMEEEEIRHRRLVAAERRVLYGTY